MMEKMRHHCKVIHADLSSICLMVMCHSRSIYCVLWCLFGDSSRFSLFFAEHQIFQKDLNPVFKNSNLSAVWICDILHELDSWVRGVSGAFISAKEGLWRAAFFFSQQNKLLPPFAARFALVQLSDWYHPVIHCQYM